MSARTYANQSLPICETRIMEIGMIITRFKADTNMMGVDRYQKRAKAAQCLLLMIILTAVQPPKKGLQTIPKIVDAAVAG